MLKLCHQQPQQWMQLNLTLLSIKVLKFVEDATNNDLTWDSDYAASRGEHAQDWRCQGTLLEPLKLPPSIPNECLLWTPLGFWDLNLDVRDGRTSPPYSLPSTCLVVLCQIQSKMLQQSTLKWKSLVPASPPFSTYTSPGVKFLDSFLVLNICKFLLFITVGSPEWIERH